MKPGINDAALSEYIERFRSDGYVNVPALLTRGEIDRFRAAVDEAVFRRKRQDTRPRVVACGTGSTMA